MKKKSNTKYAWMLIHCSVNLKEWSQDKMEQKLTLMTRFDSSRQYYNLLEEQWQCFDKFPSSNAFNCLKYRKNEIMRTWLQKIII